jgi:hypothetical protein
MTLESDLVKVLDAEFKAHREAYLIRLAEGVSRLPDATYETLPESAKIWYEACVAAGKRRMRTVPDIADFEPDCCEADMTTTERTALEELIRTATEVHRISDRAHDAWVALAIALKDARAVLEQPDVNMTQPQPIRICEIVVALEREAETETSAQWLAAQHLRLMKGWHDRTLMCHIDQRPPVTVKPARVRGYLGSTPDGGIDDADREPALSANQLAGPDGCKHCGAGPGEHHVNTCSETTAESD